MQYSTNGGGYRTHTKKNPNQFQSKVVPKTKNALWFSFIAKAFLRIPLPNKKQKKKQFYEHKFQNLNKSNENALNLA